LLFLGFRWGGDELRFPGWRVSGRCQFRCGPPKRLTLTTSAVAAEAPGNRDSRDSGSWFANSRIQLFGCCAKRIFRKFFAEGRGRTRTEVTGSRGGWHPRLPEGEKATCCQHGFMLAACSGPRREWPTFSRLPCLL
jgi:hypothetical protein